MTTKRCGVGLNFNAPEYSVTARELFRQLIDLERVEARNKLLDSDTYDFGLRFNNDDRVYDRVRSAATEAEFLAEPQEWIQAGLRGCASADHHYTYEKDWGDND